jgi:hypothetical protein
MNMSQPEGTIESSKSKIYKLNELQMPYSNMMKKMFKREKKSPIEDPLIVHNRSQQQAQPAINSGNKFPKNIIFKRVNGRSNREKQLYKGRVNSAVRKSSNFKNLDMSSYLPMSIKKQRISSSKRRKNLSISNNYNLQLSNIEVYQNTMSLRSTREGLTTGARQYKKLWNKSPQ